jgi:hypothetical protein
MKISISTQGFTSKPQSNQISSLHFNEQDVSITEFANFISKGYSYCNIFNKTSFGVKDKNKNNFRYSNIISVDIDHTAISMDEALSRIQTIPSIAYETYSNGKDGLYSYRFIYALTEMVGIDKVYLLIDYFYGKVEAELNITTDKRTKNPYQYFNGTYNKKVITNNIEYNPIDLSPFTSPLRHSKVPSGIVAHKVEKRALESKYDSPFIKDFFTMKFSELLDKYIGSFINKEHSDVPSVDADTPIIYFPDNYREIRRYWYQGDEFVRKIKDGNGRRNKLFINGIIRRLIEPSLSFDNILFNLVYEMYYYIDNTDRVITKNKLMEITKNVMNTNLDDYKGLGVSKRKYMANPKYCVKYNKTKKSVSKMKINYDLVGELYDDLLSDAQNAEVMKEYGIQISVSTLRKWRYNHHIAKNKGSVISGKILKSRDF